MKKVYILNGEGPNSGKFGNLFLYRLHFGKTKKKKGKNVISRFFTSVKSCLKIKLNTIGKAGGEK